MFGGHSSEGGHQRQDKVQGRIVANLAGSFMRIILHQPRIVPTNWPRQGPDQLPARMHQDAQIIRGCHGLSYEAVLSPET